MKAIIDGKLYDTDTAEKVYSHLRKHVAESWVFPEGVGFVEWHNVTAWKTAKGAYFETVEYSGKTKDVALITEYDLRERMMRLDPDAYMRVFGDVEEG